jgi:hypothetical protein
MNGYLMQEQQWIPGEDLFVESFSPENSYGVVFEDDGQTAYFYAVERDKEGAGLRVLDALHIQETGDEDDPEDEDVADDDVAEGDEADDDEADDDVEDVDVAEGDDVDGDDEDDNDDDGNIADAADTGEDPEIPEINGNVADGKPPGGLKPNRLQIVWSNDWMKSALVIDGYCHALFDFEAHGGYNINEFPPPNQLWTQGDRTLSDELMRRLF